MLMAQKRRLPCPNCGKNLPRGLPQLNAELPCLRGMPHLLAAGEEAFRCPYCSCVWKRLVGQASKIEITPLGFFSSCSNRLQPLPTGFKPYVPKAVKNNRPPGTAVRKSANGRKRSEKN